MSSSETLHKSPKQGEKERERERERDSVITQSVVFGFQKFQNLQFGI